MTNNPFNLHVIHPTWQSCFPQALSQIDPHYFTALQTSSDWLPGPQKIFRAFSLPLNQVNYILLGESPYPRAESANGYAFWDASIHELWSSTGLNKSVNRATSFRHILKMLLIAEDVLNQRQPNQENIAKINKQSFVQTNQELFNNFLQQGFLLLNATLVLSFGSKTKDAKAWQPFLQSLLTCIVKERPHVKFILFGQIANDINIPIPVEKIHAEHPYNHSFVTNNTVRAFFKPLHLLKTRIPFKLRASY
ncbi:MAG: hypothetical protein A3F42_04800 [Gammaproteobacteria bacterium RIFCSPHIGHO2_12_FULL_37_34]|nr:MAG: hypothetical protein A3F42_04800 [Gammaproteobacteria bacterium RIFCSPHIGHO2_12_FULL_37_34]